MVKIYALQCQELTESEVAYFPSARSVNYGEDSLLMPTGYYQSVRAGDKEFKSRSSKFKAATRKGSGSMSDACILRDAFLGKSPEEILKTSYPYDKEGHKRKYSVGKVYGVLRLKDESDCIRIKKIIDEHSEVFSGITEGQVDSWINKKLKGGSNNGKQ